MTEALEWSPEQWSTVNQVVHDEALRARVAASFLPLYGPLPGDTQSVPLNTLGVETSSGGGATKRFVVNDYDTSRLTTASVNVYLKSAQIADPELAAAQIMFRRAAAIVARIEDLIIFNGQPATGQVPTPTIPVQLPDVFTVSGGGTYDGLLQAGANNPTTGTKAKAKPTGPEVFQAVVEGINKLETEGHLGPFACVMGNDLFKAVTTPLSGSMVLPRDSILPFLDGPLVRSSTIPVDEAVLVSLQGAPIEIVVPSDIAVKYLQTSAEGDHVFRVQQKFRLRIKEDKAVTKISF